MAPWVLTTLSLLTTTISILIKPTGHPTLLENVKHNVLMLSPSQAAILVGLMLLDLIGWRLLSLADIHAGLMILNHYYFTSGPSGLEHKLWWRFTRRAFLIVGTVPLYVILLRSEHSPWIKIIVTPLVADSMVAELLSLHWDASDEDLIYNRDWPRNTLVVKPANPPTRNHHENREGADEKKKTNENRDTSSSVTTENLCERVYGLWSPVAEADDKQDPRSLPPNDANLEKIFSPTYQAPGCKCRHWRCLIYRVKYLATRIVRWPLLFGDLALITWLLHRDLQPGTLLVADALLDIRLLKDLLTLSYYACILFVGCISVVVAVRLLFRLMCQHMSFLRRIQQWFQDLATAAPITHKATRIFGFMIPHILIFYVCRYQITQIPPLSRNILSIFIELIVIPIFYAMMYLLVCGKEANEGIPTDPELQPQAEPTSDAGSGPDSTSQDSNKDAGKDAPGSRQSVDGDRFHILRLGLLMSTATIWFFFCR
ncbi:hypothetical protein BDV37DRAFT_252625 [Aspergillus pseudonomiae]|uniref:Uncharacterized protein n=1 Tax=Aspergillus pseudonomiae TaxID=1506151 RepID=A0A5N7D7Z1_9EURO|nr:uncharacterized protein BDV37DRAFT_252625 [Aspergillus pseudonomiae]KAE8402315.1 hypothetical protein BDV37DRAFT_252625 [Aspergillus pseudonomiae]